MASKCFQCFLLVCLCFCHLQLVVLSQNPDSLIPFISSCLILVLSLSPVFISTFLASHLKTSLFQISSSLILCLHIYLRPDPPILFNLLSFRSNLLSHLPSYCLIILDHDPFLLFSPLHRLSQDLYLLLSFLSFALI